MKRIIILLWVTIILSPLFAVPANKKTANIQQPDGTYITITLHGDENFSYRTTSDGLVVQKNELGYYVYCTTNSQGRRTPTSIIARNPEERTTDEMTQLTLLSANSSAMKTIRRTHAQHTPLKKITRKTNELGTKGIVILAQYSDIKFTIPNARSEFNNMLNQTNYSNIYGQNGSAKDYFVDNSRGAYTPSFTVLGPVTLPKNRAYYGGNDANGNDLRPATQIVDAITQADFTGVNLSEYDSDNDGYVDLIYVIYADQGEASSTSPENSIWQHAWTLESAKTYGEINSIPQIQGKKFDAYACSSEKNRDNMDGIGTFCHEYSHTLGLPDFYDTNYEENGESYAVSLWSVMAMGSLVDNGNSPVGFTAYERDQLGWGKMTELTSPDTYTLESLWKTGNGYKISSTKNPNEYFILENRQKEGWDSSLPAEGMLIYHVDYNEQAWYNNEINAYGSHPRFRIIPADNNEDLSQTAIAGDIYPGTSNNTQFTNQSIPAAKLWDNTFLNKPVTAIQLKNGIISFDFMGGKRIAMPQNPFVGPQSNTSAYFTWATVPGASSYLVDVYSTKTLSGSPTTESEPFKGGGLISLNGWATTANSGYSTSGNYGKASPSLKLDFTNAQLTTPLYNSPITSFSFWLKWQSAVSGKLHIKGLINDEWVFIKELPTSTPNGVYTLNNIPEGTRQISIVYQKVVGNVAIDDVTVTTTGSSLEKEYLPGYQSRETTTNNLIIEGLEPMKAYFYTVKAKDASSESLPTKEISLTIDPLSLDEKTQTIQVFSIDGTRIITIRNSGAQQNTISVYNSLGQRVATSLLSNETTQLPVSQNGVYIVEVGNYRTKVMIR